MNYVAKSSRPAWKTLQQMYEHFLGDPDAKYPGDYLEKRLEEWGVYTAELADACATFEDRQNLQREETREAASYEAAERKVLNAFREDATRGIWFAMGRRTDADAHELIPAHHWDSLALDLEANVVSAPTIAFCELRCWRTKDIPAQDLLHCELMKAKDAPPLPAAPTTDPAPTASSTTKNGRPGRPSDFHLIHAEFNRRRDQGLLAPTLREQAQALVAWFNSEHSPPLERATLQTVENRLRSYYNAAKAPRELPAAPKL